MKINLVTIGKVKEKFFVDAIKEYEKRLTRFCKFGIVELAEASPKKSIQEQIEEENERLWQKAKGYVVALDSRGKQLKSEEFAKFFDEQSLKGQSEFSILIGGSNGLGEQLKSKCDFVMSFSKMTFPHQLFRILVVEQIYRAMTINANLPYHK